MQFRKFFRLLPIVCFVAITLGGWADQNQRPGPAPRLNTRFAHLSRNPQQQNVYTPPQSILGSCVMDLQSRKILLARDYEMGAKEIVLRSDNMKQADRKLRDLVLALVKMVGVRLSTQQAAKFVPLAGQAVSAVLTYSALRYVCEQHIQQCMSVARQLQLPAP